MTGHLVHAPLSIFPQFVHGGVMLSLDFIERFLSFHQDVNILRHIFLHMSRCYVLGQLFPWTVLHVFAFEFCVYLEL